MRLYELLDSIEYTLHCGDTSKKIDFLTCDSKYVRPNSLFFAIEGTIEDGRNFIDEAIKKGATAIALEEPFCGRNVELAEVAVIVVKDIRKTLADIACCFYNYPADSLKMIGVTGTKGKTSTTVLIHDILEMAGIKTGIIGTVCNGYTGNYTKSTCTTPNPIELQSTLREMVDAGCKAVVMEVSSQGLMQHRVEGIEFNIGVFTNIFPDHIGKGEHRDFLHYMECKKMLFDACQKAIINGDDRNWPNVIKNKNLKSKIFFGKSEEYDFCFSDIEYYSEENSLGMRFKVAAKAPYDHGQKRDMMINIPGEFNVRNALAAIATTRALGVPWEIIKKALNVSHIPGRAEVVPLKKPYIVMVDYAHNGEALGNLLECLRKYAPRRLMVVFGCGGQRDRNRRFDMGRAAFDIADYIIITSDNPRNEEPMAIIEDITSVMTFSEKVVLAIPDREKAIKRALMEAREEDIIVVAGKGHETYQIIGDKIIDFDDKQVIISCGKD